MSPTPPAIDVHNLPTPVQQLIASAVSSKPPHRLSKRSRLSSKPHRLLDLAPINWTSSLVSLLPLTIHSERQLHPAVWPPEDPVQRVVQDPSGIGKWLDPPSPRLQALARQLMPDCLGRIFPAAIVESILDLQLKPHWTAYSLLIGEHKVPAFDGHHPLIAVTVNHGKAVMAGFLVSMAQTFFRTYPQTAWVRTYIVAVRHHRKPKAAVTKERSSSSSSRSPAGFVLYWGEFDREKLVSGEGEIFCAGEWLSDHYDQMCRFVAVTRAATNIVRMQLDGADRMEIHLWEGKLSQSDHN